MSSAVWVVISIPTTEREKQLRQTSAETTQDRNLLSPPGNTDNGFVTFKKILEDSFEELKITDVVWNINRSGRGYQVYFACDLEESDSILEYFASKRIGSHKDTYIGIIPFSFFLKDEEYPEVFNDDIYEEDNERKHDRVGNTRSVFSFRDLQDKFLRSMTARLTVAQVVANVRAGAEFTFDFLLYVMMAAMIATLGLLESSIVNLVASMIVSPLMGPVMAMTFGLIAKNNELRNLGIRNALLGFSICIVFGYLFGLATLHSAEDWDPNAVWPTPEMVSRGQKRSLWIGCLVALPSGVAVAVAILSGSQSSLVGVAISASLLPPCVNAGLFWSYSTIAALKSINEENMAFENSKNQWFTQKPSLTPLKGYQPIYYEDNMALECLVLGVVSLGLMVVNVFSIVLSAVIVLKIKEVTPLSALSSPLGRFWSEDVKIARDYQQTYNHQASLGEDFLREWAQTAGLEKDAIIGSSSPLARAAQMQTLRDMMKDVESDRVYQAIARNSVSGISIDRLASVESSRRRGSSAGSREMIVDPKGGIPLKIRRQTSAYVVGTQAHDNPAFGYGQRRGSNILRRSGRQSFSLWPQTRPRSDTRFQVVPVGDSYPPRVSRRISVVTGRLPSTEEAEDNKV